MERLCDTCMQPRDLGDFELIGDLRGNTCHGCRGKKVAAVGRRARLIRRAELSELENRRRRLIAALVKVDAEIAELRASASARVSTEQSPLDSEIS